MLTLYTTPVIYLAFDRLSRRLRGGSPSKGSPEGELEYDPGQPEGNERLRIFIHRPVATTLLTIGLALSGIMAFRLLPVSPLPRVDFPTIVVAGSLPGADPETMATSVAAPLERQLGHIAGITEMTSTSTRGTCGITIQFDLDRNIDGAARDVQAAINAARGYLPPNLPNTPTYRKSTPLMPLS